MELVDFWVRDLKVVRIVWFDQLLDAESSRRGDGQIIRFTAEDLATLKKRALEGGVVKKASTFDALSAHVWQARTKAMNSEPTELAQLLYAVDIRDRLDPPLPKGFMGNAIYSGCARATCEEIRSGPLSFCVQLIQKANERVTNEYIR